MDVFRGDFNWGVWGKKWAFGLGAVVIPSVLLYTADYLKATDVPPEYAVWFGLASVVLIQIGNALKHA